MRQKIVSTEVVVPIRQNEIYVYVPLSTAGATGGAQAGLIGALIGAIVDVSVDKIRTSKAEAAVRPLRDAMVDYNFDTTFQGDLRDAVMPMTWMGVDNVRVSKQVSDDALASEIGNPAEGALLIAQPDYQLSNDADFLQITLNVAMYPNNDALRALKPQGDKKKRFALANAIYHNTFTYEVRLLHATDRDHNIAIWSADRGAVTRAALTAGAHEIAGLLTDDLQRIGADAPAQSATSETFNGKSGDVIAKGADGETLRFKDGSLAFAATAIP